MTTKEEIISRFEASLRDGWHGPSIFKLVEALSLDEAIDRPLPHRHTIWEILNHVVFWIDMAKQVLRGRAHPKIGELDDWPSMGVSAEEWRSSVRALTDSKRELVEAIRNFNKGFDEKIVPDDFTYGWMLEGLCNHNLYHTGQIIILRASNP